MTLKELDTALEKTGLDLSRSADMKARNMVLEMHGRDVLHDKHARCSRCWYKENNKCRADCDMNGLPEDPVEASKATLDSKNNIQVFPFLLLYMVPVYEKLTGDHTLLQRLREEYKRMYKRKMDREGIPPSNSLSLHVRSDGV